MCSRSSITYEVWWGSDFTCRLSVCLFITLLNVRVSEFVHPIFAMKALNYRNDFDAVGYGKVLVVHPCSIF